MCGIAGICSLKNDRPLQLDNILRMTAILKHRGPDETGIYIDNRIALGHARLSIIDLSSGVQPLCNEDKTLWIVFNGEVFNYKELATDLVSKGHVFRTSTDTEVILHLYEEYGHECLSQLNGQFAFAIWDQKSGDLFAARDRVGIRPFYYTIDNGKLYFASEIKSLFQIKTIKRELDPFAIDQIFTFWTTLPGKTAFVDINELEPGHFLKVKNSQFSIEKYWEIPHTTKGQELNWPAQQFYEYAGNLLHDSVRLRMRADVPVATYLSGGLDSSGLSSIVMKNFNRDLKTFGIRFAEDDYDEGVHQKEMVSYLKTDHKQIDATNEKIGNAIPDMLWHAEKPLLRTSPIPLYLLSRLVRDSGIKVVLTGEGADEVFGGYNIFREAKIRRFWANQPESSLRASLISRLYPYIFKNPKLKNTLISFFKNGLNYPNDPFFSHALRWSNTSRIKTFYSDELKNQLGNYNCIDEYKQTLPEDYSNWNYLSKAQYIEMTLFMSNYLLSSQGDRVAMANSVEIRLPYLDYRMLEFMSKVPAKWKILGTNEKHMLKMILKNHLPPSITSRSKHPYRAPIVPSLLSGKARQVTREMLSAKELGKINLFNTVKIEKLMNKISENNNATEVESMALVGTMTTQLLHRIFVDDFSIQKQLPDTIDLLIDQRSKEMTDQDNYIKTRRTIK